MRSRLAILPSLALILLAACGDDHDEAESHGPPAAPAAAVAAPTGRVIEVTMHTDDKGNYFAPARFEAHRGDVVRFKLVTGVHNVHFVADSNPGRPGLPPASGFLQLPGQTLDVPITFAKGDYYFQCDPHALLGMVGRIHVEDED